MELEVLSLYGIMHSIQTNHELKLFKAWAGSSHTLKRCEMVYISFKLL